MPASTLSQRKDNLVRLRDSLAPHCGEDRGRIGTAKIWADNMPLTHAPPFDKLPTILDRAELLSQKQTGRRVGKAEELLETTDDVFLYAGTFSYPETECGFLFLRSLEDDHHDDGIATPFDSGALAYKIKPPSSYTNGVDFVREHELPVSDYRNLLGTVISDFLPTPDQYLTAPDSYSCRCGASRSHPFGLSGGDRRTSTFEVRIPKRVPLQAPHLRAVFVREGFEIQALSNLFAAGVSIERFPAKEGADYFHALKESCIMFIQKHLIP